MNRRELVMTALAMSGAQASQSAPPAQGELVVLAAGSLRRAMTEVASAFERATPGQRVRLAFGASGLLLERIRNGERADVFASANLEHPQALVTADKARAMRAVCAQRAVRTGGTRRRGRQRNAGREDARRAHPSGDYAWTMFERIEQQGRPGALRALSGKALQLTGGPNSPTPPAGRNVYDVLVAEGQADIFITYCTNASLALAEQPRLRVVAVPAAINVSASYGVAVSNGAPEAADAFADFLLSAAGQALLAQQGFSAP